MEGGAGWDDVLDVSGLVSDACFGICLFRFLHLALSSRPLVPFFFRAIAT